MDAIQAGVPIVSLQVPFSLTNRSYQKTLETAKEYNIKVFARDGLMGGLLSEKYIGVAPPSTSTTDQDPDLDDVAQVRADAAATLLSLKCAGNCLRHADGCF